MNSDLETELETDSIQLTCRVNPSQLKKVLSTVKSGEVSNKSEFVKDGVKLLLKVKEGKAIVIYTEQAPIFKIN